jgi:predicted ABC-type ATPase
MVAAPSRAVSGIISAAFDRGEFRRGPTSYRAEFGSPDQRSRAAVQLTVLGNDEMKSDVPGHDPTLAGLIHAESANVVENELLPQLVHERRNILYDTVGKSAKRIEELVRGAKKLGHNIELVYSDLPPLKAAQRAMDRYQETGRFVDPEYIQKETGSKPLDTFHRLLDSGLVDKATAYDNNVPEGQPPRQLSEAEIRSRRSRAGIGQNIRRRRGPLGGRGPEGDAQGSGGETGTGSSGAGVPPVPNGGQGPLSPPAGGSTPPASSASSAPSEARAFTPHRTFTADDFEPYEAPAETAQPAPLKRAAAVSPLSQLEAIPGVPILDVPVSRIRTAPEELQYKIGYGKEGAGLALTHAKHFNRQLGGIMMLMHDPEHPGDYLVVNGHQRLDLARRSGTENLIAQVLPEGTSFKQARALGAEVNLAQERGTAVDAAKYMRDTGQTPAQLAERGIDPNSAMMRDAAALRNLADPLFRDVTTGRMRPARGVVIGSELPDNQPAQEAIAKTVQELESKGQEVSDRKLAELIRIAKGSENSTEKQTDLFGTHELTKNHAPEMADILSYTREHLGKDKRLFGGVARNKARLGEGGTQVDVNAATNISQGAAARIAALDATAYASSTETNGIPVQSPQHQYTLDNGLSDFSPLLIGETSAVH